MTKKLDRIQHTKFKLSETKQEVNMSFNRWLKLFVIALALFVAASGLFTSSNAQANGEMHSKTIVHTVTFDGLYDAVETVGHSNLVRHDDGIILQLSTSKLIPGGVYTYWWIVEDPDGLMIAWAYGAVAGPNGKTALNLMLPAGAAGIADNPAVHLDQGAPGMNDPLGATVAVEIVYHGQADDPGVTDEWFTTFWVGNAEVCSIDFSAPPAPVPPSPNGLTCPTGQLTAPHEAD